MILSNLVFFFLFSKSIFKFHMSCQVPTKQRRIGHGFISHGLVCFVAILGVYLCENMHMMGNDGRS